jgi:hypothetical protein
MSRHEGFEYLAHVKLDHVKKVWKKALLKSHVVPPQGSNPLEGTTSTTTTFPTRDAATAGAATVDELVPKDGILKFYTVGNASSVQSLAEGYTLEAAARVAQEEAAKEQTRREELDKYVHCFLDIPADQSGTKPHQALINFNKNGSNKSHQSSRSGGKKKKGGGGVKNKNVGNGGGGVVVEDDASRDIVKIQVAAPLPGMEHVKLPMLLYNADRSAKTFIHPDDDDNTNDGGIGGYEKIRNLILDQGQQGVLSGGGTKAYFYCRITRIPGEHDIVSIDVTTGLAPTQSW